MRLWLVLSWKDGVLQLVGLVVQEKFKPSSKEVEVTSDNIPEYRPELENQFQSDSREVGKVVVEDKSEVREKTPREQYLENMLRNEGR